MLLVDVPVAVSRERVASRATASGKPTDRLEREDTNFHERVREGYLALAREDRRIEVLDGSLPAADLIEAAHRIISAKVRA